MKKELFIKRLRREGIAIIDTSNSAFDKCILDDFRKLKGFIQFVDFDCQISKKGGCKEHPETLKCCCFSCSDNAGFFRVVLDTDITSYARKFSRTTGFWKEGKGCILPHNMRSTTCLTHHCNYERKDDFGFGITQIRTKLHYLRDKMFPILNQF